MYKNIAISTSFHLLIIIVATLSLPFLTKKPIELPPIVSIELIQITDKLRKKKMKELFLNKRLQKK